ncbi:hypothetical protein [Mycobacterium sp. SMC-19]|uniref:hypothetical protein n=1 Tax=Mycobacterium sp. SMC-19 TaxID=3381630 RepID=UPI003877845B
MQFAQRHGEVVALFNRVYARLVALPPETDGRTQYMRLLPAWYQAIVFFDHWRSTGSPAASICDSQTLDQLTGLGYAFQAHSLAAAAPSDDAISRLRESLVVWDEILGSGEIDERLANELRAHVDRLKFLLAEDVLNTFGTEPVVEASKTLLGWALPAITRVPAQVAKKMTYAMVTAAALLHGANEVLDETNALLEKVDTLREYIVELQNPPRALEQKTPGELGRGEHPTADPMDDNTIDAEVIDPDRDQERAIN